MAWNRYRTSNKYKNKKVEVDGIVFDSKKEAKRYQELLLLEKAGEITDLQRQVKFVLIPTQREPDTVGARGGIHKGKVIEKECAYIADFVYKQPVTIEKSGVSIDGTPIHLEIKQEPEVVVEDIKGYCDPSSAGYAKFVIKRKLMLYVHGIRIKEV